MPAPSLPTAVSCECREYEGNHLEGSADHWCPPILMLRTPPDSICLLEPRVEILRAKPRLPDVPPRYLKKRLDL